MPKVKKIIIEYENKIKYLEVEEAKSWIEMINNAYILQFIHFNSDNLEEFKWKKAKRLVLK